MEWLNYLSNNWAALRKTGAVGASILFLGATLGVAGAGGYWQLQVNEAQAARQAAEQSRDLWKDKFEDATSKKPLRKAATPISHPRGVEPLSPQVWLAIAAIPAAVLTFSFFGFLKLRRRKVAEVQQVGLQPAPTVEATLHLSLCMSHVIVNLDDLGENLFIRLSIRWFNGSSYPLVIHSLAGKIKYKRWGLTIPTIELPSASFVDENDRSIPPLSERGFTIEQRVNRAIADDILLGLSELGVELDLSEFHPSAVRPDHPGRKIPLPLWDGIRLGPQQDFRLGRIVSSSVKVRVHLDART